MSKVIIFMFFFVSAFAWTNWHEQYFGKYSKYLPMIVEQPLDYPYEYEEPHLVTPSMSSSSTTTTTPTTTTSTTTTTTTETPDSAELEQMQRLTTEIQTIEKVQRPLNDANVYNIKLFLVLDNAMLKQLSNQSEIVLRLESDKNVTPSMTVTTIEGTGVSDATTTEIETTTTTPSNTTTSEHYSMFERATNCAEATARSRETGIYLIYNSLLGPQPFLVLCDERIAQPFGWMVIQRRIDDAIDFNRTWEDYKEGFGNMRGNFWMGLDKIHAMTLLQAQELLVVLGTFDNSTFIAKYDAFAVAAEDAGYALYVLGTYKGTAGDALQESQGMKFSTKNKNNGGNAKKQCARTTGSGWWFKDCKVGNLNSPYAEKYVNKSLNGITWSTLHRARPLKTVQMLMRTKKPFL